MSTAREEETELHIFKRHMGLTKRGSHDNGRLTVSKVLVRQTDNFTVRDASQFVTLIIPTAQILQTKVRSEDMTSQFVWRVKTTFAFSVNIKHPFSSFSQTSTAIYNI